MNRAKRSRGASSIYLFLDRDDNYEKAEGN